MNPVIYGSYSGSLYRGRKILEGKDRLNKNNMTWYKDFLSLKIIASKSIMFKGIPNEVVMLKIWC